MDLEKIQKNIFGEEYSNDFFKNTYEIKKSVHSDTNGRNLLLDLIDAPMFLPLFNPLEQHEMLELINNSDLNIKDSNGNNALLLAMDKNLYIDEIMLIAEKSNLVHKNNEGVNPLTIAVLNQNLLTPKFLYLIHDNRDESFSKTIKGLSPEFIANRGTTAETLKNKYGTLQTILKRYEKKLNEKTSFSSIQKETPKFN